MNMITTNQLNTQQLTDLEGLVVRCKQKDLSSPNLYTHILAQERSLPASIMCYRKNQLIGFLSAFFFYDDAVEITLLVDPMDRRHKIATELLKTIIPLLQAQNLNRLIFSSPHSVNTPWLKAREFTPMHSEYHMVRNELTPVLNYKQPLSFRKAQLNDIPILYALDEACFHKKPGDAPDRFNNLIDNRAYQLFIALHEGLPIGKAHIRWEPNAASLSDIAIEPKLQGNGYGSALIAYCINYILAEGKSSINLDVETHNQKALHLYTHLGFTIQNACDYWTINLNQLKL